MSGCFLSNQEDILTVVLVEWVDLAALVQLDSAFTSSTQRSTLHHILRLVPVAQPFSEDAATCRSLYVAVLRWMAQRSMPKPSGHWVLKDFHPSDCLHGNTLQHIQHLTICIASRANMFRFDLLSSLSLQELCVASGHLPCSASCTAANAFPSLKRVTLEWCTFREDLMVLLGGLSSLQEVREMHCTLQSSVGRLTPPSCNAYYQKLTAFSCTYVYAERMECFGEQTRLQALAVEADTLHSQAFANLLAKSGIVETITIMSPYYVSFREPLAFRAVQPAKLRAIVFRHNDLVLLLQCLECCHGVEDVTISNVESWKPHVDANLRSRASRLRKLTCQSIPSAVALLSAFLPDISNLRVLHLVNVGERMPSALFNGLPSLEELHVEHCDHFSLTSVCNSAMRSCHRLQKLVFLMKSSNKKQWPDLFSYANTYSHYCNCGNQLKYVKIDDAGSLPSSLLAAMLRKAEELFLGGIELEEALVSICSLVRERGKNLKSFTVCGLYEEEEFKAYKGELEKCLKAVPEATMYNCSLIDLDRATDKKLLMKVRKR